MCRKKVVGNAKNTHAHTHTYIRTTRATPAGISTNAMELSAKANAKQQIGTTTSAGTV